MAVNHSVYLVLLCWRGTTHESFQKERDPEIMDSFFTTMFLGRLRQRKKKAPPSRYSLKLQTHISLSINELKVAGVSVAICELLHSRRARVQAHAMAGCVSLPLLKTATCKQAF